jgi:hypothetical protein
MRGLWLSGAWKVFEMTTLDRVFAVHLTRSAALNHARR